MSLLQKLSSLFRPQQPAAATQETKRPLSSRQRRIEFIGGMMEVRSADFFGPYALSRSERWALGWRDADISAGQGGHRSKGHGTYLLYDTESDRIAVTGKLERPNKGAVADNGTFILQDWHFGDGLQGTFMAFTSAGHILHKRHFNANLYNGALSIDGASAICQTANNPNHDDGNRMTAFDLRQGIELFSVQPRTGWADEYEFSADGSRITVVHNDLGKFTYDRSGNFLDEKIYENACLTSKNFSISLFAAESLLKKYPTDADQAHRALSTILTARQVGADNDPGWKAMALKLQGIALEAIGRPRDALAIYDEVLSMNPKIGVKRRADSLRKQLNHS
ncbi:hypothetical protein [Noviherbaspirillum sp. ST9]|uniref:hypothetical protein n=1 Tax=Noviherbaspirillum sp. ST9 TaxID=3401606 RepID=UPI003B586371